MKRYYLLLLVITMYKNSTKFTTYCLCKERKHLFIYPTLYELYRCKTNFTHGDIWLKFQRK